MEKTVQYIEEQIEEMLPLMSYWQRDLVWESRDFPKYWAGWLPVADELPRLEPSMPSLARKAGIENPRFYFNGQEPSIFRRLYRAAGANVGPEVKVSDRFTEQKYKARLYSIGGDPWLAAYSETRWYEGGLNIDGQIYQFDKSKKLTTAYLGWLDDGGSIGPILSYMSLNTSTSQLKFGYPPTDLFPNQKPLPHIDPELPPIDNALSILSVIREGLIAKHSCR